MNDFSKKISEELKSEANKYTIKTSASDILKIHNEKNKKEKTPWYKKKLFMILTPAFAIILFSVILGINLIDDKPGSVIQSYTIKREDKSGYAKATIEIVNGVNLLSNSQITPTTLRKSNIDNLAFKQLCTSFEQSYPMIDSLFTNNVNFSVSVEQSEFIIQKESFIYKMEIENHLTIYLNTDLDTKTTETSSGYAIDGDKIYSIDLEKEYDKEDDEIELSIKIHISNKNYLYIKSEATTMEYGYSYELYHNDELVKEISIEYEVDDDEVECEVEIYYNQQDYEFDLTYSNQAYTIHYETDDYEGTMILTIYPTYREYFEENEKISIKIQ